MRTRWVAPVLVLLLCHTGSGLEVTVPSSQVALYRSQVVLPCSFRIKAPVIDPQFLAIIWYFGDKKLLTLDNKKKELNKGLSFDEQKAKQGDASLTIQNVTIADQGTYKCLVIYSPDQQQREIVLNVHASPEVRIQRKALQKDKKNQLYCSVSGFFPREVKVTWLRNNIPLPESSEMGGFQTDADGTYSVNNSIILTAAKIQDSPSIACQVDHVSLPKPIQDAFTVQYGVAPAVRLTSSRTEDGNELIYVCQARGFSPEPLTINWLVDGKMADLSKRSEEGVYTKEIYYPISLKEGIIPQRITCHVRHETLDRPVTETLKVDSYNDCTRNCHSGLTAVMGLVLGVALLFIACCSYLIKKKKYFRRFNVSHIHQERSTDELITLSCMALDCPEVAQATWTVSIPDREPITASASSHTDKDVEKELMLHPDYTVRTDSTERKGLRNYTSILSFDPASSGYKKTEVKCKFQCGKKSKERTLTCTFPTKKPEMEGSIRRIVDGSDYVLCSATLDKFYPKGIQIQWSYEFDHGYKDVSTTEEDIIYNTKNHTYRAVSKCKIPRKSPESSGDEIRVRVTWNHRSMDQPEKRDESLTEIPRCPVMEDIDIPPLVHGTEAKLQCNIRGYFPDRLNVKWFWREVGKPEIYEVSSGDKYKIPERESVQQTDKTYACTASLILTVSGATHQGSEFICRVTHSGVGNFLEKRTGQLSVKGIPEVQMKYVGKTLRAEIANFTPNNIIVTWNRTKSSGKTEDYKPKEITDVGEYENEDGTFTSVREISISDNMISISDKKIHIKEKKRKVYTVTVEHESLKSPIKIRIRQEGDKLYVVESGKERELPKC